MGQDRGGDVGGAARRGRDRGGDVGVVILGAGLGRRCRRGMWRGGAGAEIWAGLGRRCGRGYVEGAGLGRECERAKGKVRERN